MKTDTLKSGLTRWPAMIALSFLASCGGGGGNSGSSGSSASTSPTSTTSIFVTTLTGAEETPPNTSAATGSGTATVDTGTKVLDATVTTNGIAGTAAHIHEGAAGISGPIIFPLTQSSAGSTTWTTHVTLTDAQINTLMAGNYYFNVHSAAFPAGEIRGQIVAQQPTAQPVPQGSMGSDGGGGGGGY